MANLGCRLCDELENTDIEIKYMLDRNPVYIRDVLEIKPINQERLIVDVIVVTVAASENKVVEEIRSYGYDNVVGLSDILNECYNTGVKVQ